MKADAASFIRLLGGGIRQFEIPVYQRTYSWSTDDCQQFWDDVMRLASYPQIPSHFTGSIVYIQAELTTTIMVPRLLVIDGQQRLTTLTLFLAAIGKVMEETGVIIPVDDETMLDRERLRSFYLINSQEEGTRRYKVALTRNDRDTLFNIIDGINLKEGYSLKVFDNYNFFLQKLRKSDVALADVFYALNKLLIVEVALDRSQDNPQLIFESLNSTGVALSQSDLIRNYILMGLDKELQTRLYNTYWYRIERMFPQEVNADQFDFFMRDYLTLKNNGVIPTLRDVYRSFKDHASKDGGDGVEQLVSDVHDQALIYSKFVSSEAEKDAEIRALLEDIRVLKMEVAYPFLLEVFLDFQQAKLTQNELLEILVMVQGYVFRRAIVGIPTNSMNKTFATLTRSVNKDRYLESVKAAFLLMDSYRHFPTDEEFMQEFMAKDVYNFRNRTYLLGKLENYGHKERASIADYTIEHIMPQNENLSADWQEDLGPDWQEVQRRFLHTIGNLTLTGYNSEYSDHPFLVKRDLEGGFAQSPLFLNRGLGQLDSWNADEIGKRASVLAERALQIWPAPTLSPEVLEQYRKPKGEEAVYTLEHFTALEGESLDLYTLLQRQIMNLDPSVREEPKKLYIAYKTTTNFVDVTPLKSKLKLTLNMRFTEINDPRGWCRDVSEVGRWGNGEVEVEFTTPDQLDYIMYLIQQSFDKHDELVG